MKEKTRKEFEERLLLIENIEDREAVRFLGGRYLAYLDRKIDEIQERRSRNPFCFIKDLFHKLRRADI